MNAPNLPLEPELVERVLAKMMLNAKPKNDLAGLNQLYHAWCASIPFDSIQKRIWLESDRDWPMTGSHATEFFENWLKHGTGGTCWPTAEGLYALLVACGFNTRRVAGGMHIGVGEPWADHGSVMVDIDGVTYLPDPSIIHFEVLPLVPGQSSKVDTGVNRAEAVATEKGFDIKWMPGHLREWVAYRTDPELDPIDHDFLVSRYEWSVDVSNFNNALFITRRFPDRIISVGRANYIEVAADDTLTVTVVEEDVRRKLLVEEFGLSEEILDSCPPDKEGDDWVPD